MYQTGILLMEQFSSFLDFNVGLIEESNVHRGKKLTNIEPLESFNLSIHKRSITQTFVVDIFS